MPSNEQREMAVAALGALPAVVKVGLASGGIGFLIGGTSGILRNTTPLIFGIASSLQCATLGTSFWTIRDSLLQTKPAGLNDTTKASAIAGGASGALSGLLFRGPRNIIPGMICMAALGTGGQIAVNRYNTKDRSTTTSFWSRLTRSTWSPVQSLSNDDYAALLRERLLKVEVEIAILDDKIAALKEEQTTASSQHKDAKD